MLEYFFRDPPAGLLITLAALALLLFPRSKYNWMPKRRVPPGSDLSKTRSAGGAKRKLVFRSRSFEESLPGQDDLSLRQALTQRRAWIDFFKGAVAGHALIHYGLAFEWVEPRSWGGPTKALVYMGIGIIAILIQMMRRIDGTVRMAVPVAMILGLACGYLYLGPTGYVRVVSILALALLAVVAAKPILSGPGPVLAVFIIGFAGAGYLFIGLFGATYALPVTVALCGFPIAMNLLFGRPMYFETDDSVARESRRARRDLAK